MNFNSMQNLADDYGARLAKHFNLSDEQEAQTIVWLFQLLQAASREIVDAAIKGAERGINEAAALVFDPDFHETVKKRSQRDRERSKEWREQEKQREAERKERQANPTYDDKQRTVYYCIDEMFHARERYDKAKANLFRVTDNNEEFLLDALKKRFRLSEVWIKSFDLDKFVKLLERTKVSDKNDKDSSEFFDRNDFIDE